MRTAHFTLAGLMALALAVQGCSQSAEARAKPDNTQSTSKEAPTPAAMRDDPSTPRVTVYTVQPSTLTETALIRGKTEALRDVTISAEAAGRLEKFPFDLGDKITQNDSIARVDYRLLAAQVSQAKAAYNLAKTTHERQESLLKDRMVTPQQVDQAEAAKLQAKAALDLAQVSLQKSQIKSPLAGIVTKKMVDQGEYVNPGTPLLQITDLSTIVITAQVPESQIARIKEGMAADVRIEALNENFKGKVKVVIPTADASSRTFSARIEVPNKDQRILVGMSATVKIGLAAHNNAVVVPQDYVVEAGGERAVFVDENGVARRKLVVLGPTEGDKVMITSGLKAGERVVSSGQRNLKDGQIIKVIE